MRNLTVGQAQDQLLFSKKEAANPLMKLLKSAIASAENNFNLDKNNLYVSKILVNEGRKLKRSMARAFGRATPLWRRSSTVELFLDERMPGAKKKILQIPDLTKEKVQKESKVEKPAYKKEAKMKISPKKFLTGFGKKLFRRKSV